MTKEQFEAESSLNSRIRETDAKMKLTQESYRARDVVIDDVIRETLEERLKKKKKRRFFNGV